MARRITTTPRRGRAVEEARKEFAKLESLFAWTLWDLKAAKVDPATLKIPKP